jgi:hypothetical protein
MQFPNCCNPWRVALEPDFIVVKVFKCHSHDVRGNALRQFAAVLYVKAESMLCQLRLNILSGTAKFTINRCFHDYSARVFILSLGDLQVYVAVHAVDVNFLQKCRRDVEHLKFVSGSWWVDRTGIGLRPAVNRVYRRLDSSC